MSGYFFLQAEKNDKNGKLLDDLKVWSEENHTQVYVIDRPLGDNKYSYSHENFLVILVPKRKILIVDFSNDEDSFEDLVDDFVEDIGSISDKYRYKDSIGRPRKWKSEIVWEVNNGEELNLAQFEAGTRIEDPGFERIAELVVSLLIGSINDIDRVRVDVPQNVLEKVKRNIVLFDADQTRFVYKDLDKKNVWIQGLSGTGKTELLLHKLKEIYLRDDNSKVIMTCHNKILAESLRRRIPDFFNFMKVEKQILWDERLWCVHAWGSSYDGDSGAYRYICGFYGIPFQRYSRINTFEKVCSDALIAIRAIKDRKFAFDFMLVDESQDFPDSFFELCEEVSREKVFIAGDIFQSIFVDTITPTISPDFLLSKCYRTDPKTLMFAHALGMGLFEPKKLRWLDDDEWKACGYLVEKDEEEGRYTLKREPLRRFGDFIEPNFPSVVLKKTEGDFTAEAVQEVVNTIRQIAVDNPTVSPDDIGVIFLDDANSSYAMADMLEQVVARELNWLVNKAHETKRRENGALFVSNRNNVKGLEFPFVICVTKKISDFYSYRNALYMTMTRSFLQSYLVLSEECDPDVVQHISAGLAHIQKNGCMEVKKPQEDEIKDLKTEIKYTDKNLSFYDFVTEIFDEMEILPLFRQDLMKIVSVTTGEDFDRDKVREVIYFNHQQMKKG